MHFERFFWLQKIAIISYYYHIIIIIIIVDGIVRSMHYHVIEDLRNEDTIKYLNYKENWIQKHVCST